LGISTDGPSRDGFYFSPTYRLGDNTGNVGGDAARPSIHPDGQAHDWTFEYLPESGEHGAIGLALDGRTTKLELDEAARRSAARFDRFGIITTWIDGNSQTIYLDDLTYTFRQ
jgi:hypothetical protein